MTRPHLRLAGLAATLWLSACGTEYSQSSIDPATDFAQVIHGLRAQLRRHRSTLTAAVKAGHYPTVEREAIVVRDLVVALAGRAKNGLDAQQTVRLEQQMHDVSELTERVRLAAHERRTETVNVAHRELEGLVTLVLELTAKAT